MPTTLVPLVEGPDLDGLVGADADAVVAAVTTLARSYTRGRGFETPGELPDELRTVILVAAARLIRNPSQLTRQAVGVNGEVSQETVGSFAGWTLAELMVLNSWRRRGA